jgi:RHS repeat-associated protein
VNNLNQYLTVGGEALSHDANGKLTGMPGLTLQYDSWNRLISAATESNLVLFAYDGRNRCVKRVEIQNGIGRTTIMVWGHEPSQGWGLLEERGPNGEMLARHVHGPSVNELVLSELGGAVYYYHQDHLNSTVAVTDENGNVVEQYRYDVYGQPYFYGPDGVPRSESALGLRFLFTGREWLASLGLYDYRHRIYSPSLGRFLQMDPLGIASGDFNLYRYCANRPTDWLDAWGLCAEDSFWKRFRKHYKRIKEELYGYDLWLADRLGLWGMGALAVNAIVGTAQSVATAGALEQIRNAPIEGAMTGGSVWDRMASASEAARTAERTNRLLGTMNTVGKAAAAVTAFSTGYSVGARINVAVRAVVAAWR